MKKFYSIVSVDKNSGKYRILLDKRPVKTPGRADMVVTTELLADAIMQEWAAQEDMIIPDTMPLTQIVSTKIDRVRQEREAMTALLMKYIDTDLICYFTDHPAELAAEQEAAWNPVLDWFEAHYGERLQVTTGLTVLTQHHALKDKIRSEIDDMDDDRFTALQLSASLAGSIVLGLMFVHKAICAEDVFSATRVEERYNAAIANESFYGGDPAQEAKDAQISRDFKDVEAYLSYL